MEEVAEKKAAAVWWKGQIPHPFRVSRADEGFKPTTLVRKCEAGRCEDTLLPANG